MIAAAANTDVLLDDPLRARRQEFDRIPQIDLSGLRDGSDPQGTAAAIRWACTHVGFFYIKGHGVPDRTVEDAFDGAHALFALSPAEKAALHIDRSGEALRGYTGPFEENTNPGVTRDYKECFDAGIERPGARGPFEGPNQWPPALPGFRTAVEAYLDAMLGTATLTLEGIALSLDLPRDFFAAKMTRPLMIQRMIHYPSQSGFVEEGVIGIGAHTDYGLMTILAQDDVGGLQVMNRSGHWVEAPPIPGTFVVNIGGLMQRLTNDLYIANLHRVVNISGRERYSLPCFVDADPDAVIAPLDSCIPPDRPRAYEPVRVVDNKLTRYGPTFAHLQTG
jgi:isopenicillin N synthase-like dioxygenase